MILSGSNGGKQMTKLLIALIFVLPSFAQVDWLSDVKNKPAADPRQFNWNQSPAGSLTGGSPATVTLSPCPFGLVTANRVQIAGTGTAEQPAITAASCPGGHSTGTVTFTPANSHSAGWTISTPNGGLQEAEAFLGASGGVIDASAAGTYVFHSPWIITHNISVTASPATMFQLDGSYTANGWTAMLAAVTSGTSVSILGGVYDGNLANNPTTQSALLFFNGNVVVKVEDATFQNANFNTALTLSDVTHPALIRGNRFLNNAYHNIEVVHTALTNTYDIITNNVIVNPTWTITSCGSGVCTTATNHSLLNGQNIAVRGTTVAAQNKQGFAFPTGAATFELCSNAGPFSGGNPCTIVSSASATGGTVQAGGWGVALVNVGKVNISNNSVTGGAVENYALDGVQNSSITGNNSNGSGDGGIACGKTLSGQACQGNQISGNQITESMLEGLWCYDYCVNNSFDNVVTASGTGSGYTARKSGIAVSGSHNSGNSILGKSIGNNEYGVNLYSGAAGTLVRADLSGNSLGPLIHDGADTETLVVDFSGHLAWANINSFPSSYANGSTIFCSDCNSTCTAGSSTGRVCFRENAAWTH
jgi:hypothetical protein